MYRIRRERDAALAAFVEINDRQTEVVRVRLHVNFQIDTAVLHQIRAEAALAITDFVAVLDIADGTIERRTELRQLRAEIDVARLPIDARMLPAALETRKCKCTLFIYINL